MTEHPSADITKDLAENLVHPAWRVRETALAMLPQVKQLAASRLKDHVRADIETTIAGAEALLAYVLNLFPDLMPQQQAQDFATQIAFYDRIDAILLSQWDPIGIVAMGGPINEYRDYAYRFVLSRDEFLQEQAVFQELQDIRTFSMRLPENAEADRHAAKLVCEALSQG